MDEATAEYAVEQLTSERELKVISSVTVACKSDVGRVREINQDKFEYFLPEDRAQLASRGLLFVVCDGMGGAAAGQVASELACKTFIDVYLNHPAEDPVAAMRAAVNAANRFVLDNARAFPDRRGMGTTLSCLILLQDQAYTVQVGDSRIYRMRQGTLEQLTTDHTWVEEAVRAGMLSPHEAETHPHRHVITRAVGVDPEVQPDIEPRDLLQGDEYLICSDGVMNHVSDDEIAEILKSAPPSAAAWKVVNQALIGGGTDNTTAIVVRVDSLEPA